MPSPKKCILSVAYDPVLLMTRELMLENAGFTVVSANRLANIQELSRREEFDLAIICHGIPSSDKKAVFQMLRQRSAVPVLALRTDPEIDLVEAEHQFDSTEGPAAFIWCVSTILSRFSPMRAAA